MGFISGVKDTLKKGAKKLKEYQEQEPERRAKRIAMLKEEEKRLKLHKQEVDLRSKVQRLKRDTTPQFNSGGFNVFGGSPFVPETNKPKATQTKKKKSKGKIKRKEVYFFE